MTPLPRRAPKSPSWHTFIVGAPGEDIVKIGYTDDVAGKLRELRKQSGRALELLWVQQYGEKMDAAFGYQELLNTFDCYRHRFDGWYARVGELAALVDVNADPEFLHLWRQTRPAPWTEPDWAERDRDHAETMWAVGVVPE